MAPKTPKTVDPWFYEVTSIKPGTTLTRTPPPGPISAAAGPSLHAIGGIHRVVIRRPGGRS